MVYLPMGPSAVLELMGRMRNMHGSVCTKTYAWKYMHENIGMEGARQLSDPLTLYPYTYSPEPD